MLSSTIKIIVLYLPTTKKHLGSPSLGSSLVPQSIACVDVGVTPPFHITCGNLGLESRTNAHILATVLAVSNTTLCLWSRSLESSASIRETMAG